MAENKRNEGYLVTLQGAWAASNIAAGTPVQGASATNAVYTLGVSTTGAGTGHNGQRFLGVLAHSVSASDTPITVYTKGVFKFLTAGTFTATNMDNGNPVWPNSGMIVQSRKGTLTGDAAIGTIVGREAATITSGNYIKVKINPGSYRWMYCAPASVTATSLPALSFPPSIGTDF